MGCCLILTSYVPVYLRYWNELIDFDVIPLANSSISIADLVEYPPLERNSRSYWIYHRPKWRIRCNLFACHRERWLSAGKQGNLRAAAQMLLSGRRLPYAFKLDRVPIERSCVKKVFK